MLVPSRWWPRLWAVALAVLMLWPVLGSGYVLSYDMVWVPDLVLRQDALGLGSGLPRAVPSDALVAVLDEALPGMVLQKIVLLGALVGAGWGAARLVPGASTLTQLVAVSLVVWNPFVVERLAIGQWPVLVGYAVLPWLVAAGRRTRDEGRVAPSAWWLMPLGSLSASAGLVSAVVLLVWGSPRRDRRTAGVLALLVAAANAPWLAAGLLHASSATSDPAGARVFALHGEGSLPAPLAALGLGGIWNAEVVPVSRTGPVAWVGLVVLVVLAGVGVRAWAAAAGRREVGAAVGCWALGMALAVSTWLLPGQLAWVFAHVPGAGLLRDGSRTLALCVPALVGTVAHGSARLVGRHTGLVLAAMLVPVALLPDAAGGLSGRLRTAHYPEAYDAARRVVQATTAHDPADVLVLPFTSYRAPAWNGGRKVLDPVGRFLGSDYVASDRLSVSGLVLGGEDPRARRVARALTAPGADARSRRLAALGIGLVVTEPDTPGPIPSLTGRTLLSTPQITVRRITGVRPSGAPYGWVLVMGGAWAVFLGCPAAGVLTGWRRRAGLRSADGPSPWYDARRT